MASILVPKPRVELKTYAREQRLKRRHEVSLLDAHDSMAALPIERFATFDEADGFAERLKAFLRHEGSERRDDGKRVPRARWENGLRSIASIIGWARREFEIDEVVEHVRELVEERTRARKLTELIKGMRSKEPETNKRLAQTKTSAGTTEREWTARERYMLFVRGFRDGAAMTAMRPEAEGIGAYDRGYAEGCAARGFAAKNYAEEVGHEPTILRTGKEKDDES